jgi:hypothetical protein
MIDEAPFDETEAGLVPAGAGWFVLNARRARWIERPGRGKSLPFTGWTDSEAETWFPQVRVNLVLLRPGDPIGMYHWEGQERPLRQWDFVHCPPETRHMIVGAGDGPCAVMAVGAREHIGTECNGGAYTVDEVALRHGAGVEEETTDPARAYARFANPEPTRHRDGWLPG